MKELTGLTVTTGGDVFVFFVFVKILWETLRYRHNFRVAETEFPVKIQTIQNYLFVLEGKRDHNVPHHAKKNIKIF